MLQVIEAIEESTEPLGVRLGRSEIAGSYYRDLSLNYIQYQERGNWPVHPFPGMQHYTSQGQ